MAADSRITLNDGRAIPQLGLGTYQVGPGRAGQHAIEAAIEFGYRHFDTASIYANEAEVGAAIRAIGVPRDEVWVTTKLWNDDQGRDSTRPALEASLARLGFDFVDLYLLHWPHPLRLESWRELERAHADGLALSIGVSNFMESHLEELLKVCTVRPAANQIEMSPFLFGTRRGIVDRCAAERIAIEAYCPLTKGQRLNDHTVVAIADEVGGTPAGVLIRWSIQHEFIVLPRSSNNTRIRANAAALDLRLSGEQMHRLDALDEGLVTGWNPEFA